MTDFETTMNAVVGDLRELLMDDVKLTVRLPADLHQWLSETANRDARSLNAEIVWLLRRALKQRAMSA